jgi:uncharacterized short protein YbdD (DUF466 family)
MLHPQKVNMTYRPFFLSACHQQRSDNSHGLCASFVPCPRL